MIRRNLWIGAIVTGLAVSAWVARLTRDPGPGLSPDGMSYLGAAASLVAGHAPRVPFSGWDDADSTARLRDYPPGFPAEIALLSAGASLEQGGRRVEIVAGGLGAALIVVIVGGATMPAAGVLTAVIFALTPPFVEDHSIVLSEPSYLVVLLVMLLLLSRDDTPPALPALAAVAGVMVRYVGLSLAGAAALVMLLRPGPLPRRLGRAAAVALPAGIVFVLWSRWAGGAREYGWKAGFFGTLGEGWGTIQAWIAPSVPPGAMRVLLALLGIGLMAVLLRRGRLTRVCGIMALAFAALLIVSRLFADEAIPFDNRLLTPLFALAAIALGVAVGTWWRTASVVPRVLAAAVIVLWLAGDLALVRQQVRELDDDGWGYASRDWQRSDLAGWLRTEGRRYAIFSDNAPSVYSLVHRPSRMVPETADTQTVAGFGAALRRAPSALVGFKDAYNPGSPHGGDFARRLGWREAFSSDEGTVWLAAPEQEEQQHRDH